MNQPTEIIPEFEHETSNRVVSGVVSEDIVQDVSDTFLDSQEGHQEDSLNVEYTDFSLGLEQQLHESLSNMQQTDLSLEEADEGEEQLHKSLKNVEDPDSRLDSYHEQNLETPQSTTGEDVDMLSEFFGEETDSLFHQNTSSTEDEHVPAADCVPSPSDTEIEDELFDDVSVSSPVPLPRLPFRAPEASEEEVLDLEDIEEYSPPLVIETDSEDESEDEEELNEYITETRRSGILSGLSNKFLGFKATEPREPKSYVPNQQTDSGALAIISSGGHKTPFLQARARFNRTAISSIRSPAVPLAALRAKFEPKTPLVRCLESENPMFKTEQRSKPVRDTVTYPPKKNHWSIRGTTIWKKVS